MRVRLLNFDDSFLEVLQLEFPPNVRITGGGVDNSSMFNRKSRAVRIDRTSFRLIVTRKKEDDLLAQHYVYSVFLLVSDVKSLCSPRSGNEHLWGVSTLPRFLYFEPYILAGPFRNRLCFHDEKTFGYEAFKREPHFRANVLTRA